MQAPPAPDVTLIAEFATHSAQPAEVQPAAVPEAERTIRAAPAAPAAVQGLTDAELRTMWRNAGGSFHGPNIETGTMPESKLLPFLRAALSSAPPAQPVAWQERQQCFNGHGRPTGWTDWYASGHLSPDAPRSKVISGIEYQWRPLYAAPPSESQAVRALRVVLAWYDGAVGDEQLAMALRTGRAAIAELDRMETCRPEDHPLKDSGWFGMPSAGKEDDDTRSSVEDVA